LATLFFIGSLMLAVLLDHLVIQRWEERPGKRRVEKAEE
jgi:hypothetical protein